MGPTGHSLKINILTIDVCEIPPGQPEFTCGWTVAGWLMTHTQT
jgi:hypothetical protein